MGRTAAMIGGGLVTIGIATALFLPGRTTAQSIRATGDAGSKLLGTAIRGR